MKESHVVRCKHCHHVIRKIVYALGEKWMHVDVNASFPTERKGTAWEYCKMVRAEPETRIPVSEISAWSC